MWEPDGETLPPLYPNKDPGCLNQVPKIPRKPRSIEKIRGITLAVIYILHYLKDPKRWVMQDFYHQPCCWGLLHSDSLETLNPKPQTPNPKP